MAEQSKALQKQPEPTFALTVNQFEGQIAEMDQFVKKCLKPSASGKADGDYGVIPGCGSKPTLLQPGADKLCRLCALYPDFEISESTVTDKFIRYVVRCSLTNRQGAFMAAGLGSCNSAESKWQKSRGGKSPYEQDNTLLKMARKRAYMAAVITATRLHHKFTQDIEDMKPRSHGEPEYQDAHVVEEPDAKQADYFANLCEALPTCETSAEVGQWMNEIVDKVRANLTKKQQGELNRKCHARIKQLVADEKGRDK